MTDYHIAVIGAGVVGLSTALCIQNELPAAEIVVIADKYHKDTLSDGSGGLFAISTSIHHDAERVKKWYKESLEHFMQLANTSYPVETGVKIVEGYSLYSKDPKKAKNQALPFTPFGPESKLTNQQLSHFPSKYKYGVSYHTAIADCRCYLPWLKKRLKNNGVKFECRLIRDFSDISDRFDLIINCTGLGAKELLKDNYLIPIRGQTIRVKAPWIRNFFFGDNVYIIPGINHVTLGGVKDFGSWNTDVNPYQKSYIWDECVQLVPSLEKAEIIHDWVGLRPYRPSLCLNTGVIQCGRKLIRIVNNYGHGSSGVSLSWGTAKEAAVLAKEILRQPFFESKL